MKLNFRHGIVQYSVDNTKVPTFLYTNSTYKYVDLSTSDSNVVYTFAHGDTNYLYVEQNTTKKAWGPFNNTTKYWLFWELHLLTGERTFASTNVKPITSYEIPSNPVFDQYFFSLANHTIDYYDEVLDTTITKPLYAGCGYVWNGYVWIEKLRLVAGTYYRGEVTASLLGTQIGIEATSYAGYIVYSDYNTPAQLATNNGTLRFLTTDFALSKTQIIPTTISFQSVLHYSTAVENIAKYKIVTFDGPDRIKLANNDDLISSAGIGIVEHDITTGMACTYVSQVFVTNPNWNYAGLETTPVYLGLNGDFTFIAPSSGIIQKVGQVVNATTVHLDLNSPAVYLAGAQHARYIPMSIDVKSGKYYTSSVQTQNISSFVHYFVYFNMYIQTHPTNIWRIPHNENLTNVIIKCQDVYGRQLFPANIHIADDSTIEVTFVKRTTGKAFIFIY